MGQMIVVVDGHPAMRLGLVVLLGETEMHVVGETGEGEEALRMVKVAGPDLVVLGLNLAGELDGIETCQKIKALPDAPYVLVYTAYNLAEDLSSCLLAGADSYLHKRAECNLFLDAVRRTARGERVWSLGDMIREPRSHHIDEATLEGHPLTPREQEVLGLVLRRYSNAEIADDLGITLRTVKNHVGKVFMKLGVRIRKELFKGTFERLDSKADVRKKQRS